MCLNITKESLEETKALKAKHKPIVAYKILKPNMQSMFKDFPWQSGENISDRESSKLFVEEKELLEINQGFHFFTDKPEICQSRNLCRCRYPCRCPCRYLYLCLLEEPVNKVFKVEILPEDLIAIGTWENLNSLAATKCKILEEISS